MAAPIPRSRRTPWRRALRRDWQLYSLAVLPLLFFLTFRYLPMLGNVIAFRRFQPGGSIVGEYWTGLRYFRLFFTDPTYPFTVLTLVRRQYTLDGQPVGAKAVERAMADEAPDAVRAPEVLVKEQPGVAPARMS